jgi:predicted DNA binding CopG/RHH family protein
MKKRLPRFANEDQEREFWAQHDSADYLDWKKGERVILPNLRPTSQTISLRLPKPMVDRLKLLANKRDVPYQRY